MGVKGLYTIIKNAYGSYRMEDLVSIAKLKNGIEIFVDFHAFQGYLIEIISRKLSNDYENDFLLLPTHEYDIFKDAFTDVHNHFKEVGITLVWVIDGPKGVDKVATQQKEKTLIKRDKNDIKQMNKVLTGCKDKSHPKNMNNRPLLSIEIAIDGLRAAGAEIIQLLQGRSEGYIALKFHERKAFAIISNDTDFLLFPGLKVIFPTLMFKRYGKNNLPFIDKNPGKIFKKPNKFLCPIITQDDLLKLLKLSTPDQLVALGIIKGNDNTIEYAQDLQYILRITNSPCKNAHVTHVARFIATHGVTQENIRSFPRIDKFLSTHPHFDDAITFCYDLYTLKHFEDNYENGLVVFDPTFPCDPLTRFIQEKLSKSQISKKIYAIHRGYCRSEVFTERPTEECLSNNAIMKEIRSRIYPYLLDSNLHEVVEYDPCSDPREYTLPVEHATFKTDEIEAKRKHGSEPSDGVIYGIDIFEEIWSHLEQEPLKYVETFGLGRGFICYLLRYFYVVNKGKNLNISTEEFQALFITVFYKYAPSEEIPLTTKLNGESFLRMRICPTERCLFVYTWFMNIYFTGKYLCGGAFNLTEHFPSVENVMSGSVLYAFYENMGENDRTSHLDRFLIESIEELGKEVLERFSAEYDSITK